MTALVKSKKAKGESSKVFKFGLLRFDDEGGGVVPWIMLYLTA